MRFRTSYLQSFTTKRQTLWDFETEILSVLVKWNFATLQSDSLVKPQVVALTEICKEERRREVMIDQAEAKSQGLRLLLYRYTYITNVVQFNY